MTQKLRLGLCTMILLLSAGACFGVTVHGKDGDLALSQIGDIIQHVTGTSAASGDLMFEKNSLYMFDVYQ